VFLNAQADPLKETLDGVLPIVEEGAEALGTVPITVPQSIEEVGVFEHTLHSTQSL